MAHSHSIKEYPGQLAALMALAAAVGALTALFTAPFSGTETRGKIRKQATTLKTKLPKSKSDMSEAASTAATKTADKIDEAADETDSAAKSATTRAGSTTRRTSGNVTERIRRQGEP